VDRFAKLTRLNALQGFIKLLADQREQHVKLCSRITEFMVIYWQCRKLIFEWLGIE